MEDVTLRAYPALSFFTIFSKFRRDFDTDSQGNGEGSTFSEALNE